MRRYHQRDAEFPIQFVKQLMHSGGRLRIEVPRRLVGQQQLGPQDDRARDRDALLLAAGQFSRTALELVAQADDFEHLGRAPARFGVVDTIDQRRHHHVFLRREVGQQVMELEHEAQLQVAELRQRFLIERKQILALEKNLARGRLFEAADYVQQRGLAGSRLPDYRYLLAGLDVQIEMTQHANLAIGIVKCLVEAAHLD